MRLGELRAAADARRRCRHASLNLSNAVAVGAYEVWRQWGYPRMRTAGRLTRYDD